ncbi:MAG: T9SS type A sorting domain-containing protein [Flavobacteriales bacterium]|nr:T9SS type A sorting domain-containing protein [Flavobacteriales bacterium]
MKNLHHTLLLCISVFLLNSIANAQANPCVSASTFKIVVLGSSTAAGSGVSTADSAWVNRYRNHLQSINPANEVINLAVGGYNTYRIMPTGFTPPPGRPNPDVARNITAALAESPDAIIVNMPSNDVAAGFSYSEQMFNLDTVVQIATAASVPIWICTTQPRNFSAAQAQLQSDLKDSILVQFAPNTIDFWTTIATPTNTIEPFYDSGDGVHLNDAGHDLLESRVIAVNIPENVYVSLPDTDPAVVSITPVNLSACGDSLSEFEFELINLGPNDSLPVTVTSALYHFQSATNNVTSATISSGLTECSIYSMNYSASTIEAGDYSLTVVVSTTNNFDTSNDTLAYTFSTSGHPTWTPIHDTLCDPGTAVVSVNAASQDTVIWYADATNPTPIAFGNDYFTPFITSTSDWYAEVVRGNLYYSDDLFTTNTSSIDYNGTMFDLVAHDSIVIDSFDVKINSTGTQSIEIYKKAGSHLGYELIPGAWTLVDAVTVNVSDPTVQTHVPFSAFSMNTDDTVGIYLKMANSASKLSYRNPGSPQTRSTSELTMITGSGVNFNMTSNYFPRDWNGRVYYHYGERLQGDCSSGRFPVTAHLNDITFESIADTIIDIFDTLEVTSSPGMMSYEWMDGSTNNSFEFIASQFGTGIHYVTVFAYDSLSCYHEDTVIVGVADLVGLNELNMSKTVYPNPTTGILNFAHPNIDQIEVFTLDGKKVTVLSPLNGSIDLSALNDGFYLLSVSLENHTEVIKVLKENH